MTQRRTYGFARVHVRDGQRAAQRSACVALFIDAFGLLEVSLPVERVMTEEAVTRSGDDIRSRFGSERDPSAARLSKLGLEAVGLDLKLGNRLERRRQKRRFRRVSLAVRIDGNTVEGRAERPALPAAERRAAAGATRFGHGRQQIKRTAHRPADDERQFINESVRHGSCDFRVFGLHCSVVGHHVNRLRHRTKVQRNVDTSGRARGDVRAFDNRRPESLERGLDPIRPGRQVRGAVAAGFGRHDVRGDVGSSVDDFERDARHRRACRIDDDAGDRAALGLCESKRWNCNDDGGKERHRTAPEVHLPLPMNVKMPTLCGFAVMVTHGLRHVNESRWEFLLIFGSCAKWDL